MDAANSSGSKTNTNPKRSLWLILILALVLILLLLVLFIRNKNEILVRLSVNRSIYFNKRNMPDKAIKELLKAYKIAPESPEIIYNMMNSYFLLKDYEKAQAFARILLSVDKDNKDALWIFGFVSLERGKENDAMKYFEKLYAGFKTKEEYIKNSRYLFAVSYLELKKNRFNLAIRDLEILKGLFTKSDYANPLLKRSYLMLGEAYTAIGNYTDAFQIYKGLTEIDKNFPVSYLKLSLISFSLKDYSDFLYYLDLARHFGLDSYNEFINYFKNEYEKILPVTSDSFLIGDYYIKNQEVVSKISDYYYLGYAYGKENDYENAMKTYQKIFELSSDVKGIHCAIGKIYEDKKDYNKAKEHFLKELETNPIYYEALMGLKRISQKIDDKKTIKTIENFDKKLKEKMLKEITYNQMYIQDGLINTKKSISTVYTDFEVIEDGDYSFMIMVQGKKALDAYPLMSVFINGALVSRFYVDNEENKICFANKILKKGNHRLKLNFDNDYYDNFTNEDRNLYLTKVIIFK